MRKHRTGTPSTPWRPTRATFDDNAKNFIGTMMEERGVCATSRWQCKKAKTSYMEGKQRQFNLAHLGFRKV